MLRTQPRSRKNDATRVGVVDIFVCEPKVAPASQPWADGWNPVGIQIGARTSVRFSVRSREALENSASLDICELKRRERRAPTHVLKVPLGFKRWLVDKRFVEFEVI